MVVQRGKTPDLNTAARENHGNSTHDRYEWDMGLSNRMFHGMDCLTQVEKLG